MKTLSLLQPWATLVVIGAKKFETRSWSTAYRGPLLIHASKRYAGEDQVMAKIEPFFTALLNESTYTGAIIGKVDLVDCISTEEWMNRNTQDHGPMVRLVVAEIGVGEKYLKQTSWKEYEFGDYSPGRFAWKLENPVKLDEKPISARGSLGLWEFDESALGHLAERVK